VSEATLSSLIPAASSTLSSRCFSRLRSSVSLVWYRVKSRTRRTSSGGRKLPRSSPTSINWASHWESRTSVLRPGTALTCAALTTSIVRPGPPTSRSAEYTGHQYGPVDSIATCVTPSSTTSHDAIANRSP
jgi:hypothetical protein